MPRYQHQFIYPPAVTKKILGSGLSVFTMAAAVQKSIGSTPFSVVRAPDYTLTYWIAYGYTTLGFFLGLFALIHCLRTSSLRYTGLLGSYLLAFGAVSFINTQQSLAMQTATCFTFVGASTACLSAWLRYRREGS